MRRVRPLAVLLAAALCTAAALAARSPRLRAQTSAEEVRALWVVRTSLTSAESIAALVSSARANGFNTLVIQIRGRGDAYFLGGAEPRPPSLEKLARFDPLAAAIAQGHAAGLKVHAWVNVNLVAGIGDLPESRAHIVRRHPEWLMVPQALAGDLAAMNPRRPEYLERLAAFTRAEADRLEGLYLSPITPDAADYTVSVVRDIARRYAVDGVHLDYIRYPSDEFDYSRESLLAFRKDVAGDLSEAERRTYDARLAASPAIYAQMFPERWRGFRMSRLTDLVIRLREAIKAARPDAVVSAAVVPDSNEAAVHRLQNWRDWLTRGLIDVVCPMAYTTDAGLFSSQIAAARDLAGTQGLWAGIGAYRMTPEEIAAAVRTARRARADGVILFSYDSLVDPARRGDYFQEVARAAFGSQ